MENIEKTHWLQNPNKNYLGHQDLPNGKPVVLTIKTAQWEGIENPRTKSKEDKRVVRFTENYKWIKPLIINETNACSILKTTGVKYMEDSVNYKLKLYIAQTKVMGEMVDCIRISEEPQESLIPKILNKEQLELLQEKLNDENCPKSAMDICNAYNISSLKDLPQERFTQVINRLTQIIEEAKSE